MSQPFLTCLLMLATAGAAGAQSSRAGLQDTTGTLLLAGLLLLAAGVFWIYLSVSLSVIARKTATPGAWMAWFPVLNMALLCQIARKPMWWLLLLLVPLLNLIAIVALWMGAAEQRGRSGALGLLILVPGLNVFLPLILAVGAARKRSCPACQALLEGDETFCGNCGGPVAPARPAPAGFGGCLAVVLVFLTLLSLGGVGGFLLLKTMLAYTPPRRQAPSLPKAMAGTMREFPLDTATKDPARPTATLAQSFPARPDSALAQRLPPGIDPTSLPAVTRGYTSSRYRTAPQAPPVDITVLNTTDASVASRLSTSVSRATGSPPAGIMVTSPRGQTYTGTRLKTTDLVIYILRSPDGTITIVVRAPVSEAATAERLTSNIGNSEGLNAGEQGLWVLPATPVDGFRPTGVTVVDSSEMTGAPSDIKTPAGQLGAPEEIVSGTYAGPGGEYTTLVGRYGDPQGAWVLWWLLRALLATQARTQPCQVFGSDGIYYKGDDQNAYLFFLRGPYVVGCQGPASASPETLRSLGQSLQI